MPLSTLQARRFVKVAADLKATRDGIPFPRDYADGQLVTRASVAYAALSDYLLEVYSQGEDQVALAAFRAGGDLDELDAELGKLQAPALAGVYFPDGDSPFDVFLDHYLGINPCTEALRCYSADDLDEFAGCARSILGRSAYQADPRLRGLVENIDRELADRAGSDSRPGLDVVSS